MAEAARYFFDEHLPNAAVDALRAAGADVLTIVETARVGIPDDDQLRFATADGRVMVTHDEDYTALAAQFWASGETFAGVAYCHPLKYRGNVGGLIAALLLVHGAATADEMMNHVEYL